MQNFFIGIGIIILAAGLLVGLANEKGSAAVFGFIFGFLFVGIGSIIGLLGGILKTLDEIKRKK